MEVAAPSAPSPLREREQPKVQQNGVAPLPSPPATQTVSTATPPRNTTMPVTLATPAVLSSRPIALGETYPGALAKHQDVVASKELFLDTLNKFHTALGTRLAIPKMGGKDLDLHVLYVQVTQRGGLQQVIKDRKWKEITGAFNFPRTTTSASYVLRKYYVTLLHHYEQAYFFGSSGPLVAPPTPLPAPSPVTVTPNEYGSSPLPQAQEEQPVVVTPDGKKVRKKRQLAPIQMVVPVDPMASIGHVVTGAIEGKFEHGYLVTVMVGAEKLRGVIYHVPTGHRGPQHAAVPQYGLTSGAEKRRLPEIEVDVRKRRREDLKKDPNAPRPNRTGYNFFFAEERAKLKLIYPDKERELSRMIGNAWNKLTEHEKMPWQDRGVRDKERYKKEMKEYEQLKSFQEERGEAVRAGTATAGDGNHHGLAGDSEREPPSSAPVTQHNFDLDQLPQIQQFPTPPHPPPQQFLPQDLPQQFVPAPQISTPTPQQSNQGQENVVTECSHS